MPTNEANIRSRKATKYGLHGITIDSSLETERLTTVVSASNEMLLGTTNSLEEAKDDMSKRRLED